MRLITHRSHLDALPASNLKIHIRKRFDQLSEDTDVPPNIVLVEATDDIAGKDYAFVGPRGLLSDLWEEHEARHPEFCRVFEWAAYISPVQSYEALVLLHDEDGYWIMIPESIVESHPDLYWVLTAEEQGGLSSPQPL
jgi:hypothetical protein